jgi:hypothetical protein
MTQSRRMAFSLPSIFEVGICRRELHPPWLSLNSFSFDAYEGLSQLISRSP